MEMNGQRKMWESFRAEARRRDAELEAKVNKLETAAHSCDTSTFDAFVQQHDSIGADMNALRGVIASMADVVNSCMTIPGAATEVSAMQRATQRFEDVCTEKSVTLRRLLNEARKRKERSELLRNVHTEIAIFDESADMRHLANENESLRHTQRQTRQLLEQADANRAKLRAQREMFEKIGGRAVAIAEQVPVIKDLLKRIDSKRQREAVVVGSCIGLCFLLVFIFW